MTADDCRALRAAPTTSSSFFSAGLVSLRRRDIPIVVGPRRRCSGILVFPDFCSFLLASLLVLLFLRVVALLHVSLFSEGVRKVVKTSTHRASLF